MGLSPTSRRGFHDTIVGDVIEELIIDDTDAVHAFGACLGSLLAASNLVMLNSPLGAGKTTMTHEIAEGMGVTERVALSTLVTVNAHGSLGDEFDLAHVDAYRPELLDEVDALDLDVSFGASAAAVERDEGKVGVFTPDRLMAKVIRPTGGEEIGADCPRELTFEATGERSREIFRGLKVSRRREFCRR